jgi:hypothetical protein
MSTHIIILMAILPVKIDVYSWTIQQKDNLYAKSTPECKHLKFMGGHGNINIVYINIKNVPIVDQTTINNLNETKFHYNIQLIYYQVYIIYKVKLLFKI